MRDARGHDPRGEAQRVRVERRAFGTTTGIQRLLAPRAARIRPERPPRRSSPWNARRGRRRSRRSRTRRPRGAAGGPFARRLASPQASNVLLPPVQGNSHRTAAARTASAGTPQVHVRLRARASERADDVRGCDVAREPVLREVIATSVEMGGSSSSRSCWRTGFTRVVAVIALGVASSIERGAEGSFARACCPEHAPGLQLPRGEAQRVGTRGAPAEHVLGLRVVAPRLHDERRGFLVLRHHRGVGCDHAVSDPCGAARTSSCASSDRRRACPGRPDRRATMHAPPCRRPRRTTPRGRRNPPEGPHSRQRGGAVARARFRVPLRTSRRRGRSAKSSFSSGPRRCVKITVRSEPPARERTTPPEYASHSAEGRRQPTLESQPMSRSVRSRSARTTRSRAAQVEQLLSRSLTGPRARAARHRAAARPAARHGA